MDSNLSAGDLALMRDDGFGGANSFMWIFALLILMFGMGGNWVGGGNNNNLADQMNQGFTNQQLQQIALSSANNNYETAQLVNDQTNLLMQQNNTNLINAIQGFNNIGLQIQNQTSTLQQQLMGMQAQLNSCCCDIKTQMLQYRLQDAEAKNVQQANQISNFEQNQYLLGQMGRWVAYAPSTTAAGG